jgi:hypothetical protein
LWSLIKGIKLAFNHNNNYLIVEGDSQVIILLISKIVHDSCPSKVSPRWWLMGILEELSSLLQTNLTLIPSHVKRESNKVSYHLANERVVSKEEMIQLDARISPAPSFLCQCMDIARSDFPPLDGVAH